MGIEPVGFDSSVESFTDNIGFDLAGLDLTLDGNDRVNVRSGFSFYSGEDAALTPSQVSIFDRRRFVIMDGQPGPNQWQVAYISNDFSSGDTEAVRAAIDGISPSEPGGPNVEPAPTPVITAVVATESTVQLQWTSVSGANYQIETTADLAAPTWDILSTTIADSEQTEALLDRDDRNFFRVRVLPEQ